MTQMPIHDPKHAPWNNVVKHIGYFLTSFYVWVTNFQNTRDLVTQMSHLEHCAEYSYVVHSVRRALCHFNN